MTRNEVKRAALHLMDKWVRQHAGESDRAAWSEEEYEEIMGSVGEELQRMRRRKWRLQKEVEGE